MCITPNLRDKLNLRNCLESNGAQSWKMAKFEVITQLQAGRWCLLSGVLILKLQDF